MVTEIKEPWQMTKGEYISANWKEYGGKANFEPDAVKMQERIWIKDYQNSVADAIRNGIRPSDEVLREFPEEIVGQWRHDYSKTFGEEKQAFATQGEKGVGYPVKDNPLYVGEPWTKTWAQYRVGNFWGMTRRASPKEYQIAKEQHRNLILKAIREGKPVPAEVLKDYPDLTRPSSHEIKHDIAKLEGSIASGEGRITTGQNAIGEKLTVPVIEATKREVEKEKGQVKELKASLEAPKQYVISLEDNRSVHARQVDQGIEAKEVTTRGSKEGVAHWRKHPNRMDIRGVDTPRKTKKPPTRAIIDRRGRYHKQRSGTVI